MNNKNIARVIIIFLLIVTNITACTASGPADIAKKSVNASLHGDCKEAPQYLTSEFIARSGGEAAVISQCQEIYDKHIQAENKVEKFKVVETIIEDDGAMVVLKFYWEGGQTSTTSVMLELEDGQWKIWTML